MLKLGRLIIINTPRANPMDSNDLPYFRFTSRARHEKSINSLIGLIEGISIDSVINTVERNFITKWLQEHDDVRNIHPFNEFIPAVEACLTEGQMSASDRDDVMWLCERLRSSEYYDKVTADIQRLSSIVVAIASDGVITEAELRGLADWLGEHEHLAKCWPYDEISSLATSVLQDGKIDEAEHDLLMRFFGDFSDSAAGSSILVQNQNENSIVGGICAVCPELSFSGTTFCFTGESSKFTRSQLAEKVVALGGIVTSSVSAKVNYLIVGADGNPCWAYACYGRKVEKAIQLRKSGSQLIIVHENDFHDAIADQRA